jgi:hypothetical protein
MRNMNRKDRTRIGLNRETLRHLGAELLADVVGGRKNMTVVSDCCRTTGCGPNTLTGSGLGTGCTTF